MAKIIKRVKSYAHRQRLGKFRLIISLDRRMRVNLIKTLKIINGISNYGRNVFKVSFQT